MKIRRRDGTMAEVGDDYILQDGEAMTVPPMFMDSKLMVVHDGNGHPAGQRPGFLYSDANEQAEQALVDAYAQYDAEIGRRWRQRPDQRSNQTQSAPQTFESPGATLAAAYAQYDRDISERWRK